MPDLGQLASQTLTFLEPLYQKYGYIIVLLGGFFENTLFFGWLLPGGTLASLGGFYSRYVDPAELVLGVDQKLSLFWVTVLAVIGAILGKVFDYWMGRLIGMKIVSKFRLKKQEELAKHFITKHGTRAFFLTSVTGPLRSILMLTSGIIKTNFGWFLSVISVTSIIWGSVFVLLGYFLGQNKSVLEKIISYFSIFGWILILGWIGLKVYQKIKPSYPPDNDQ